MCIHTCYPWCLKTTFSRLTTIVFVHFWKVEKKTLYVFLAVLFDPALFLSLFCPEKKKRQVPTRGSLICRSFGGFEMMRKIRYSSKWSKNDVGEFFCHKIFCVKKQVPVSFFFEEKLTSLHPKTGKKRLKLVHIEQTLLKCSGHAERGWVSSQGNLSRAQLPPMSPSMQEMWPYFLGVSLNGPY